MDKTKATTQFPIKKKCTTAAHFLSVYHIVLINNFIMLLLLLQEAHHTPQTQDIADNPS